MDHFSQYRRPRSVQDSQQSETVQNPKYPMRPPGPSVSESFMAGYQNGNLWSKNRLSADEWYDLNYLNRAEWLAKYPQRTSQEYTFWSQHARKRQQKTNQPNWLERALIPPGLRNKVPGLIRAII